MAATATARRSTAAAGDEEEEEEDGAIVALVFLDLLVSERVARSVLLLAWLG
jgi:hypothetical protein